MKERPIILKPWEVRAFLDGRKTQIRRLMSPQPIGPYQGCAPAREFLGSRHIGKFGAYFAGGGFIPCPFGKPGDRLWVRETWRLYDSSSECACYDYCTCSRFHGKPFYKVSNQYERGPWRSPVTMPRWASRIELVVVNIRVERLQDITEEDARAEGVQAALINLAIEAQLSRLKAKGYEWLPYSTEFRGVWEDNYGPGSWAANDWVWVIEVEPVC